MTGPTDPGGDPVGGGGDSDTDPGTEPTRDPFELLPQGQWSYVPVDGMVCGDGSATGIGVEPGTGGDVLLVFAGGGACWDALTCHTLAAASHLETGWGAAELFEETRVLEAIPLFNREAPSNPFRDATWVYVPYCTGDLHIGDAVKSYLRGEPLRRVHHKGDVNTAAMLALVSAEAPRPDRVWAMGFSAGGYGVQLQADRFEATWPDADHAVLGDCSPMLQPASIRWNEMRRAWNMRVPTGCSDCSSGYPAILQHQIATLPGMRFGLTAYTNDAIIGVYTALLGSSIATETNRLLDTVYGSDDVHAFVVAGDKHVMMPQFSTLTGPGGVRLSAWVLDWADGSSGWRTVR